MSWNLFLAGLMVVVLLVAFPLSTWASEPPSGDGSTGAGATAAAVVSDIVYVPGKAIVCGLGTVASVGVMILTLGSAYRAAIGTFKEGCGGTWVLTPEHVAGKIPPKDELD